MIAAIIGGFLALVALMFFIWVVLGILKFIAVVIAGAATGGAIGLLAAGLGLDIALAGGVGLIVGILVAYKLWRVIPGPGQKEPIEVPLTAIDVQPIARVTYDGAIESEANKAVRNAWLKLTDMVPSHKLEKAHQVRNRCAQLLAISEGAPLDLKLVEWSAHFRRNLPALADEYASLWRHADRVKQNELIEAIMVDLINIEKYADQTWSSFQSNKGDDLTIIRNHLAQKATGS